MTALPTLQMEEWPFVGQTLIPINIHKACQLLGAGYAAIPCELDGTNIHGYAWMIKTTEEWKEQRGVKPTITAPTKPT